MQTSIAPELADDPRVLEAEKQIRRCVHCGFCLATCPTYNLVGDELDSPRGRIYLVKQVIEGHEPTRKTQFHLDRCLTCRACETTCPSGVEYAHLVDQGRALVEERVTRPLGQRLLRAAVLSVLPFPKRVTPLVKLGQLFRPVLPRALSAHVPPRQRVAPAPVREKAHGRTMLVLDGCVQPSMTPATNAAARRVLDALGVALLGVPGSGCCGAVPFHLNAQEDAKALMRRNIDAWWPGIEAGAEAIVTSASGCGVMVKDYGHALADDPAYADKAARVASLAVDIAEVIAREDLARFEGAAARMDEPAFGRIAYHAPCTLQHGQKLPLVTENLLERLGFELVPVANGHLCCGSAGTYSIFHPEMSEKLRDDKVRALTAHQPDLIVTSNIGCQLHIGAGSGRPVLHWIELLARLVERVGEAAGPPATTTATASAADAPADTPADTDADADGRAAATESTTPARGDAAAVPAPGAVEPLPGSDAPPVTGDASERTR